MEALIENNSNSSSHYQQDSYAKIYLDNLLFDGFQQCSHLEQDTNDLQTLIVDFANETRFYSSDVDLVKGIM